MHDPYRYNIVRNDEKVAQKHHVFFVWCKKDCPLTFTERLIWSVLVKAERMKGEGATHVELAELAKLNRKTVGKGLKEDGLLRTSGLVAKDHYRCCRAVEPDERTAGWFATRTTKGKHWADKLAYWPVDLGDRNHQHAFDSVFWSLLCLLKGMGDAVVHECHESLAALLGCDYRRVKKALARLKANHVVETINTRKNRYGKIVRFDVRFKSPAEKSHEDQPVECDDVQPPKPTPAEPSIRQSALSKRQQEDAKRFARIRSIRAMMKDRMRSLGYQEWEIGQIVGAMEKIPTDDMRRVFQAIIKKQGRSARAVLNEVQRYVERRKRQQRAEARELITLEMMADSVTV